MAHKSRAQKLVAYLVRLQHITLPHTDVKWFQTLVGFSSAWSRHRWMTFGWNHAAPIHPNSTGAASICFHRLSTDTRVICSTSCALVFLIYYIFLSYIVFNVFVKLCPVPQTSFHRLVVGCTALCFVVVCWVTSSGLALFYLNDWKWEHVHQSKSKKRAFQVAQPWLIITAHPPVLAL